MKKKGQEKKQLAPIFEAASFWQYQSHQSETLDKVDGFLNNYNAQLKALIAPQKSFQQNYQILCEKIGTVVHPSLVKKQIQSHEFPNLKNNDYGQKFAVFLNHKIDCITLRLFAFLISNYKLTCLKISNNCLEKQYQQVKKILDKEEQLTTLYFEWNPLPQIEKRQQFFVSLYKPSIQHLILRQCGLGNTIAKDMIKIIKESPDQKLKSFDLYGNQLTNEIKEDIVTLIEESKTLEFIGLSKNKLNSEEFIIKMVNSIGEIALSEEEFEQHKQKQKSKEEVVQRNKKRKKGTPEQPVPFVFEIKQTEQGKFYVKNVTLKIINLANNGIKDVCAEHIKRFAENQGKNVELFIQGNKFTKSIKQTLKFYDNVIS